MQWHIEDDSLYAAAILHCNRMLILTDNNISLSSSWQPNHLCVSRHNAKFNTLKMFHNNDQIHGLSRPWICSFIMQVLSRTQVYSTNQNTHVFCDSSACSYQPWQIPTLSFSWVKTWLPTPAGASCCCRSANRFLTVANFDSRWSGTARPVFNSLFWIQWTMQFIFHFNNNNINNNNNNNNNQTINNSGAHSIYQYH